MTLRSRGFVVAVLGVLVGALVIAGVAPAHKKSFRTNVSIVLTKAPGADQASGQLSSPRGGCEPKRTVILFEDKDPNVFGDTVEIGRTKSGADGTWTVPIQSGIKSGRTYYAQAKARKLVNNARHKHICKARYSANAVGT